MEIGPRFYAVGFKDCAYCACGWAVGFVLVCFDERYIDERVGTLFRRQLSIKGEHGPGRADREGHAWMLGFEYEFHVSRY